VKNEQSGNNKQQSRKINKPKKLLCWLEKLISPKNENFVLLPFARNLSKLISQMEQRLWT